jgi:hypothetical protein
VTRDELEESLSERSALCDGIGEAVRRGEKAPGRRYEEFMLEHTCVARAFGGETAGVITSYTYLTLVP